MNLFNKLKCSVSVIAVSAVLVVPVMAANEAQWKKNDKGWWYEEANGTYPTNQWKFIKDKWYYFDNIGYMVENRWVGHYYLGADGAMLVSTSTPDGYYVDASGKWVEGTKKTMNISKRDRSSSGGSSSSGSSKSSSGRSSRNVGSGGGSYSSGGSSGGSSSSSNNSDTSNTTTNNNTAGNTNNNEANNNASGNHNAVNNNTTGNTNNNAANNNTASTQETQVINALMAMGVSEKEAKLYYMINAYRESLGLPKLSFSKSLTTVARTHVRDSNTYTPENQVDSRGEQGNLHSWSSNGSWTPVVYTSDHKYAGKMWSKPRELTSYTGSGYEISSYSSGVLSPNDALNLWKGSTGHNNVITGRDGWGMLKTMGVAIDGRYAHVWFGSDADPAGYYDVANYDVVHP